MVKKKSKVMEKSEENTQGKEINYWMITSVVLAVLLLVSGIISMTSGISKKTAEAKFLEFAQEQGADVEVLGVKSIGDLYEITFDFSGQEGAFHITKDGKYVGQMVALEVGEETETPQTPASSEYTQEDIDSLKEFNTCLATKGVKVYGANWCGYTQAWVATLGGSEAVAPIYVECTENDALCSSEEVTGYPTTKINGQVYNGARTIEAIAAATGCAVPQLVGGSASTGSTAEASC